MIDDKDLIKIYKNKSFRKKNKYSLSDFIEFEEVSEIYEVGSGLKVFRKKELDIPENLRELGIPSFFRNEYLFTTDRSLCVHFVYLDLYIMIQKYNKKFLKFDDFKSFVFSYFNLTNRENNSNSKNKSFLVSNKQSIELPRDKALYPSLEGFRRNLGFVLLEVPNDFKRDETFKFLRDIKSFIDEIGLKKVKTNFRIRKILKIKKNGMFIVNANTLVIDPRSPKKVIHEIGHYIYENGLAFNLNGKRIYKNQFKSIIKKNQGIEKIDLSKYEDYDKDSEIFAYWFEDQFK